MGSAPGYRNLLFAQFEANQRAVLRGDVRRSASASGTTDGLRALEGSFFSSFLQEIEYVTGAIEVLGGCAVDGRWFRFGFWAGNHNAKSSVTRSGANDRQSGSGQMPGKRIRQHRHGCRYGRPREGHAQGRWHFSAND